MSTDDRDIDSSNPSKNFKVGDFDQLSGFFTPVWESKRRIRSEPPAPPSSKGNSNRPAPSSKSAAQREGAAAEGPDKKQSAEEPARTTSSKGAGVPRPRSSSVAGNRSASRSSPPARAATPIPPAPNSERAAAQPAALPAELVPAVAAVFNAFDPLVEPSADLRAGEPAADPPIHPPIDDARDVSVAAGRRSAPGPLSPPAAATGEASRPARSAAARALRDAGPDLPPAAFLDQEPEIRSPRSAVPRPVRSDRPGTQQRALRAATRAHEQLKAKLQQEAAELEESRFDLDPETNRDPLQELEGSDYGPYPLSLMRRLRRTIRLSIPVPDPIRSLISKYDRG